MSSPNIATKTVTLKANSAQTVNVTGQYFACLSATTGFAMSIDGAQFIDVIQGIGFPTSTLFTSIVFQNKTNAACTIVFITGSLGVIYQPPQISVIGKDAPTYSKPSDTFAIGAGGWSPAFTGTDTDGQQRKHFIVSNLDAGANMFTSADGVKMGTLIPPLGSRVISVSGSMKIFNAGAAPANCSVEEIFYT